MSRVRVAAGQTLDLSITLTQAPRQLSTIHIVTSPVSVDAATPELPVRLDRGVTRLLPSARDAASLVVLVPGARKDQLWGGVPGVSNDYQIDGVSMNHPGVGGDFLSLSVDWVESVDIRGLGAGAEHGNFQGGIINAITKTGTNDRRFAFRSNYESAELTASNFNANEQGSEQAGRREVGGEALGPLARDRLFYFVAGQFVSRDVRSPNLITSAAHDFQPVQEEHLDTRGIGKLSWLPAVGQRVDLLGGVSRFDVWHAGVNGVDDPTATQRVRQPTAFYGLTWNNAVSSTNQVDVRIAGFTSRESRRGDEGPRVPGVQLFQLGRMPTLQNAVFDERRQPSSIGATAEWRTRQRLLRMEHQFVIGGEISRGKWWYERTRNGGLTWRPYTSGVANFDPFDARTWQTVGSDWGGDVRINSDVASDAAFLQDYVWIGNRVTLTPGIRHGSWSGFIRPYCSATVPPQPCYRFEAVRAEATDPRIGIAWDVTGRSTFALKGHWGRYHQGMFAGFFDRAAGANVYANTRFYYTAPALTDGRQTYTPAQRDAPGSGFSSFFDELILNEAGRVEGYRQPYVDQSVFALEKSLGSAWKAEVTYTRRRNGDIVGLVDRNRAKNYSPVYNVRPDHRFVFGVVLDARGNPLELPVLYVSNQDIYDVMHSCGDSGAGPCPGTVAGYSASDILPWNPDVVLTAIPEARRTFQQFTMLLRTVQTAWRGEGSVSLARLRGNVPGLTGYGTTGTQFTAGPFVRPNEAINFDGFLPDALEMEGKLWLTARLRPSLQGGLLYTHVLGERFAPTFQLNGRYVYRDSLGTVLPTGLFRRILGQTIFVEPRGSRQYASRDIVDAHLEWRSPRRLVLSLDLFNVFGSNALVSINTNIGDQEPSDPTSVFAAPRLRVSPRTLRIGLRVD